MERVRYSLAREGGIIHNRLVNENKMDDERANLLAGSRSALLKNMKSNAGKLEQV